MTISNEHPDMSGNWADMPFHSTRGLHISEWIKFDDDNVNSWPARGDVDIDGDIVVIARDSGQPLLYESTERCNRKQVRFLPPTFFGSSGEVRV